MIVSATSLEEANARHEALLSGLHDGVVMQDQAGVIQTCNASAERILGLTAQQMMGLTSVSPTWRVIHEDGSPFPGEDHPAPVALRTGQPIRNVVMGVFKPDGSLTWILTNATPLFHLGEPSPHAVVSSFADITERVAERAAVQQANERIRLATDSGAIGIWDWDITRNRLVWDDWMYRLYGIVPCDTETVELWTRHMYPDDIAPAMRALRAAIDGPGPFETEFRVVWTDGSVHHIRGMGQVTRDRTGRALRMVGVNWDVTQQRRLAAEVIRQTEQQAEAAEQERAFFRNSTDFLYVVGVIDPTGDSAFRFETASPAAAGVTGWKSEDLIGKCPKSCFPPKIAALVNKHFRACLEKEDTYIYAHTCIRPDGTREFEGSITPIRHPTTGAITRLAGSLRDVTERKRMQDAMHHAQKMEVIGRLAAGVSHDFNNILQVIGGGIDILRDETTLSAKGLTFLDMIDRATRRGAYLTHHLLAYSRKQILTPQIVDLRELLDNMTTILSRTLGTDIAVSAAVEPPFSRVKVDRAVLETALMNLAINAGHAMPDGGSLRFEVSGADAAPFGELKPGRHVVIAVTDSGSGMTEAVLARVFEPFFTTKGLDGTGLGLAMVQGFCRQSGGDVRVTSTLGQGTRFELWLLDFEAVATASTEVETPVTVDEPGHVLVVDDAPDVLITLTAFLRSAGLTAHQAAGGKQALLMLEAGHRFDVLVTDYQMPSMKGPELIRRARMIQPDLLAIVVSGYADVSEFMRGLPSVVLLLKPFQRNQFIAKINLLLAARRANRGAAQDDRSGTTDILIDDP